MLDDSMNLDQDYDNDGNNIVPCPICLSNYCPSKEDNVKCPEEDSFVKAMEEKKYNLKLPKGYLSFSQIDLWLKSPDTYRKKYYGGVNFAPSVAMVFGNEVTEAMERGEDWVAFIPRYPVFERKLLVEIEGIPVVAYIDNSEPTTNAFREQKTGKTKWTENKVNKHIQLPLYSLLLEIEDGFVTDECILVDVRTRNKTKVYKMGDIEMKGESRELELTGEVFETKRIITDEDRAEMRKTVIRVGREIEEDYAAYRHLYE